MKIRRIIIYDKKNVKYSILLEEIKKHIKTTPMFIGTSKQWNKFLKELQEND